MAIIATDLAELLGSAIALNLLFPRLPLFAGVLITAADVMLVLLFFRSNSGRQGMMLFEIVIVTLVLCVFVSFMILLHLIQPEWREVFLGLVPSRTLVKPGALYVGVGIIGGEWWREIAARETEFVDPRQRPSCRTPCSLDPTSPRSTGWTCCPSRHRAFPSGLTTRCHR